MGALVFVPNERFESVGVYMWESACMHVWVYVWTITSETCDLRQYKRLADDRFAPSLLSMTSWTYIHKSINHWYMSIVTQKHIYTTCAYVCVRVCVLQHWCRRVNFLKKIMNIKIIEKTWQVQYKFIIDNILSNIRVCHQRRRMKFSFC